MDWIPAWGSGRGYILTTSPTIQQQHKAKAAGNGELFAAGKAQKQNKGPSTWWGYFDGYISKFPDFDSVSVTLAWPKSTKEVRFSTGRVCVCAPGKFRSTCVWVAHERYTNTFEQKPLTDTPHTDTLLYWGYDICEIRTDTAAAPPASKSTSLPAFERPSGVQEIVGQRLQMNAKRWKANNRKKAIS